MRYSQLKRKTQVEFLNLVLSLLYFYYMNPLTFVCHRFKTSDQFSRHDVLLEACPAPPRPTFYLSRLTDDRVFFNSIEDGINEVAIYHGDVVTAFWKIDILVVMFFLLLLLRLFANNPLDQMFDATNPGARHLESEMTSIKDDLIGSLESDQAEEDAAFLGKLVVVVLKTLIMVVYSTLVGMVLAIYIHYTQLPEEVRPQPKIVTQVQQSLKRKLSGIQRSDTGLSKEGLHHGHAESSVSSSSFMNPRRNVNLSENEF